MLVIQETVACCHLMQPVQVYHFVGKTYLVSQLRVVEHEPPHAYAEKACRMSATDGETRSVLSELCLGC